MHYDILNVQGEEEMEMRRRKKKKCPTFEEVTTKMEADFAAEACMLVSWGWIDEAGNENNATMMEDIMSLDPAISAQLSEDEIEACVVEQFENFGKSRKGRRMMKCVGRFEEEEQEQLKEMAAGIASFR